MIDFFSMKETAAAAITERLSSKVKSSKTTGKESMLSSYAQAVNHLTETDSKDEIITEAGTEMVRLIQPKCFTVTISRRSMDEDRALLTSLCGI